MSGILRVTANDDHTLYVGSERGNAIIFNMRQLIKMTPDHTLEHKAILHNALRHSGERPVRRESLTKILRRTVSLFLAVLMLLGDAPLSVLGADDIPAYAPQYLAHPIFMMRTSQARRCAPD